MSKAPRFFCDNCHTCVPQNASRCPKCGRFFASIRCPKCGFLGDAGLFSKGCPRCGYSSGKKPATNAGRPPKTARISPLLAVCTGFFILICSILLFVLTR
ncbi:MAG: hypothetical protein LBC72_05805 [Spirochaetaceae bacterium]|nr:hypothetical protein [Spirochaetaceae bacterium]